MISVKPLSSGSSQQILTETSSISNTFGFPGGDGMSKNSTLY